MIKPYCIRVVLAISIDGRLAYKTGDKTNLGKEGDRKVLEESLTWADATIMGAKTLKVHQSTCLIRDEALKKTRKEANKSEQPISIIASNKQELDVNWLFFNQPVRKWLISNQSRIKKYNNHFEKIILSEQSWNSTFEKIYKAENIKNILILGGAELIHSIMEDTQIDQFQLTITPRILGGKYLWISNVMDFSSYIDQIKLEVKEPERLSNNEVLLKYYIKNRPF